MLLSSFVRLDAIACDAELQEKSAADLRHIAEILKTRCEEAMKEYKAKLEEDPNFEGKRWFTFSIPSVRNWLVQWEAEQFFGARSCPFQ